MAKSSKEKVLGEMVKEMAVMPTMALDRPRNRGSIHITWEKKTINGKPALTYSVDCDGEYDTPKTEFTSRSQLIKLVKEKLETIPGPKSTEEEDD